MNWEDQSCSTPTEKWKTEEHELMIDSGCLGYVCPPRFAPQFPMVSSTNVEAVAANNVALQHCGQKVMYGHVMTSSGKRILIQITFDVDERAQTCPEHFCTETSWQDNLLQSRLWPHLFSNETVNLVSHDCHSYLYITLANGIPPRKALVMAGEKCDK